MKQVNVSAELRSIGIKNTKNKAAILQALKTLRRPIDASELHLICSKTAQMNLATVYRTLQQFKAGGLLREFPGGGGVQLYEYCGSDDAIHPHFHCERCNETICLDALGFEAGLFFSKMAGNHQVKKIDLLLRGLCEKCRSAEAAGNGRPS